MILSNEHTSPWINVDGEYWASLTAARTPKRYGKKQTVYHQEHNPAMIFIVKSGRVRITSYQLDGMEKHLYIAERGCLFGENSCFLGRPHYTSAVAIVDSDIYCIPRSEFEKAMRSSWELTQRVVEVICRKNSIFQQQIIELSFAQALQRIARVLLNLGSEYGMSHPSGLKISIRFTHQDVANITNASRVTVSNVFNALGDEGMLLRDEGCFVLTDIPALTAYADGIS